MLALFLNEDAAAFYNFNTFNETLDHVDVNLVTPGVNDLVSAVLCRSASVPMIPSAGPLSFDGSLKSTECTPTTDGATTALTETGPTYGDLTVQLWAKADTWAGAGGGLVTLSKTDSDTQPNQWYVGISSNKFQFFYGAAAGNGAGTTLATECTDGEWCHIAVSFDNDAGTNGEVTWYINGVQKDTTVLPASPNTVTGNLELFIGVNPPLSTAATNPSKFFDGLIDEVGIYDTILPSDVIAKIADGTCAGWKIKKSRKGKSRRLGEKGTI